ncbi:FCD domain-containing protein [Microbacterium sp. ASV81]|uniref:FCD domain-containing protein n=1 Tax=Microbacterium capsulatum TaxID=3041921 RepID=A0ABU0XDB4_9MICO|nr:FCD domain-containing protein [Microbacterium sp. ASV81]MDQ4213086.1 FCD domain-containing protein [Microbacterium sp. ASV81]
MSANTDPAGGEAHVDDIADSMIGEYLSLLSDRDAMEITALDVLAKADGPVGSSRLWKAWAEYGIVRGQATAGRLLDQFEVSGYSKGAGPNAGRTITSAGLKRRDELVRFLSRRRLSREIIEAADASVVSELVDVLHARRGLESEAVRLAAERASVIEVTELLNAANDHLRHVEDGGEVETDESRSFHMALVRLSHNEVIISTLRLLLEGVNPDLQTTLQEATELRKATVPQAMDHQAILEAILARDGDRAARLVEQHFTELIAISESIKLPNPAG